MSYDFNNLNGFPSAYYSRFEGIKPNGIQVLSRNYSLEDTRSSVARGRKD